VKSFERKAINLLDMQAEAWDAGKHHQGDEAILGARSSQVWITLCECMRVYASVCEGTGTVMKVIRGLRITYAEQSALPW
jgi:hypothetical protein